MADVIEMLDVSREFGVGASRVTAVRGVNLAVHAGELVAIVGRSGSGKTTLLGLAGGLDRPDRGCVRIAGQDLGRLQGAALDGFRARTVGWVFQTSGLLPLLTAAENVSLALRIQGEPEQRSLDAAIAALEEVGLAERARHRAHELSGGEQQRVALARAMVKNPTVILADEPTGQLDSETAIDVMALLKDAAGAGVTVVVATHDEALADLAGRVLHMEDGALEPAQATDAATRS
jgi:putative ABC transport system ATP-binding protein